MTVKKLIAILICLTVASVCFAQSDPAEGYWLSVDEKTNRVTAGWQIYQENGVLFGKILSLADQPRGTIADQCKESYKNFPVAGKVNTMPVAGTTWIYGLTRRNSGDWSSGTIINPEDGKMYNCRVIFHAADGKKYLVDTLETRGEIGLGIGRSQFWRKSDQQSASSLWPN
jgi:uncharacterized protein (DUF2147 family)